MNYNYLFIFYAIALGCMALKICGKQDLTENKQRGSFHVVNQSCNYFC